MLKNEASAATARQASPAWLVALLLSCTTPEGPRSGSETHFLASCAGGCPEGACECGVCTRSCTTSAECTTIQADARCVEVAPRVAQGRCSSDSAPAFCDLPCIVDADCSRLAEGSECRAGFCRTDPEPSVEAPPTACDPDEPSPEELLVLGDSLIELTSFTSYLEREAIAGGLLGEDDHFRQAASSLSSFLADGSLSIGSQYADIRDPGALRIVVMNGGETDLFPGLCEREPYADCPVIKDAVLGAERLFDRMNEDGVEHLVYFFYPDPIGVDYLEEALDVLRPILANACGHSPVPCHWVDLRPEFAGHPEFLAQDGMLLSDQGAEKAAATVWERMQQQCIVPRLD